MVVLKVSDRIQESYPVIPIMAISKVGKKAVNTHIDQASG